MSGAPPDMLGLAALVFALGLRHGLDPDHLVAIDGLTRSTRTRWSGLFFSLGHGVVVTLIGVAVALAASEWQAPAWLEPAGAGISIGVLLLLGFANLALVLRAPHGAPVAPVGLRGRWLALRLRPASHPVVIAAVGAAFALSFDTVSHALLFSLTGASLAGWAFALALGLLFTAGMALVDALNGWWVARMIAGADRRAARLSRAMSIAVSLLCLGLAAVGIAKHALPHVEVGFERLAPALSVLTLVCVAAAYVLSNRGVRRAGLGS
jgi:high-affinity nickel-transport protein